MGRPQVADGPKVSGLSEGTRSKERAPYCLAGALPQSSSGTD